MIRSTTSLLTSLSNQSRQNSPLFLELSTPEHSASASASASSSTPNTIFFSSRAFPFSSGSMDVGPSIEEGDVGRKNSSKEEVKKGEGGALMEVLGELKKKEEIWKSRRETVDNALADAQTAARQDQAEVFAHFRSLVRVIMKANVEEFISEIKKLADQTNPTAIFNFKDPSGRSLLHIAAGANEDDILELLLSYVPDLIAAQDVWGDTPLHVAVKSKGYRAAVFLIRRATMPHVKVKYKVLRMRNKQGNTALHEAVLNHQSRLVLDLLTEDSEPVYWKNTDQKSPLFLALDTGSSLKHTMFFKLSLKPSKLQGLSPVHGAILRKDYGLVTEIQTENRELFAMTDSRDGNVFHLAAHTNQSQVFELLRSETEYLARQKDGNGDIPIHIASKMGHVELIEKLHPVSHLQNERGQTVLHVAAKYGRASTVRYILGHLDLGKVINKRDSDGNTALHLAAMHSQPAALIHLLLDERIKPFLLNHNELTAIDIALNRVRRKPTFRKLLAFTVLESASAVSKDLILQKPEARDKELPRFGLHMNLTKEVINSRLLVAALVATVTFTAGFAVPGGFNGADRASKDDLGMAMMLDKGLFQAFTICNTIAMFCSMIAVVTLMMAQQSDFHKAITAFQHTILPLAIALTAMSSAFLTGVTLTVGKLPWLARTIFCLGFVCLLVISGATLLEYPYFYRGHCRLIRLLTSRFVLAYIYLWGVETDISGDWEDDGKQELH